MHFGEEQSDFKQLHVSQLLTYVRPVNKTECYFVKNTNRYIGMVYLVTTWALRPAWQIDLFSPCPSYLEVRVPKSCRKPTLLEPRSSFRQFPCREQPPQKRDGRSLYVYLDTHKNNDSCLEIRHKIFLKGLISFYIFKWSSNCSFISYLCFTAKCLKILCTILNVCI